jgi:hypothetical protein
MRRGEAAAGLGSLCCACIAGAPRGVCTACEQSTPNQPLSHQQKPLSHRPRAEQSRRQKDCFGFSQ